MIRFESWSPDGRIFAFWVFDEEQSFDYSYPPGTLYFLNAHTGVVCSYPHPAIYVGHPSLTWQAKGNVIVHSSDSPRLGRPCEDFAAAPDTPMVSTDLLHSLLSPDGSYKAVTRVTDATSYTAETSIVSKQTDKVEDIIQWKYRDAIGAPGGGQWLTNDQFLIHETLDQGPLLVSVGSSVTRVAAELFGQAFECGEDCYLAAKGALASGTDHYHLALLGVGSVSNFPDIQLFHSESSHIEETPFQQGGFFSPDGKWLAFYDEVVDTQKSQQEFQIWVRPVDPIGSSARLLAATDINPLPLSWSPESTKLAIPSSTGLKVFTLSNGTLLGAWEPEDYQSIELLWSPDSQSLALRGDLSISGSPEALFLITVP